MLIFLVLSRGLTAEPIAARRLELNPLLKALQWKPAPPADPDNDTSPNPGWYNPSNRQALAKCIAKYPETEEAYPAEVWLIFSKANVERSRDISEWRSRRVGDGKALKRIITKTACSGTAKIATVLRACVLLDAEEHAELRIQVDEILSRMHEYETETDEQFLVFVRVTETSPSAFEPYLRRMRIISECHQGHLKEALVLAEELQRKFPAWAKREGTAGNIYLLKRGESPYPTWKELKNAGPTFEELKRRSKTK